VVLTAVFRIFYWKITVFKKSLKIFVVIQCYWKKIFREEYSFRNARRSLFHCILSWFVILNTFINKYSCSSVASIGEECKMEKQVIDYTSPIIPLNMLTSDTFYCLGC